MVSLLVVIAVLIGLVIVLLPQPDREGGSRVASDPPAVERDEDATASTDPASSTGAPSATGSTANTADQPTETYPADEGVPDGERPTRETSLWWLPETDRGPSEWGTLYLVLDDAGRSLDELRLFLDLPFRMTVAVLPLRDYSVESALEVGRSGNEVLLHLPMEPLGNADPGAGAVRVAMLPSEIRKTLLANLESVPGAVGANNHMGSRATADAALMGEVLLTLREQGLFFLDSRTSAESVARTVASRLALPFAERHVFLDNVRERDAILESIGIALERVHKGESVVMIGHVTAPVLAETLREIHPVLAERGYFFGTLSSAVTVPRIAEDSR